MWRRESVNILTCILMACPAVLYARGRRRQSGVDLQFSLNADPVTVTVSGKVTDKRTGQPIPNALVRGHVFLWKYQGPELNEKAPYLETRTDAQGLYTLEFVTALTMSGPMKGKDSLCVYVAAPGYETLPQYARPDVTPENARYENFDFALDEGQRISGVVVDQDGHLVEGAVVKLQGGENGDWDFFGATGQTKTDASGQVRAVDQQGPRPLAERHETGLRDLLLLGLPGEGRHGNLDPHAWRQHQGQGPRSGRQGAGQLRGVRARIPLRADRQGPHGQRRQLRPSRRAGRSKPYRVLQDEEWDDARRSRPNARSMCVSIRMHR